MMNLDEVLKVSRTNINVGDYVYFEAGFHNYPLGKVIAINADRYTVQHSDSAYKVSKSQLYKTDGKKKTTVFSEFELEKYV